MSINVMLTRMRKEAVLLPILGLFSKATSILLVAVLPYSGYNCGLELRDLV